MDRILESEISKRKNAFKAQKEKQLGPLEGKLSEQRVFEATDAVP